MSGFYVEDMPMLQEEAARYGLRFVRHAEDTRWTRMECVKE